MRIAELTTYTSRLNGGVFYALSALLPAVARAEAAAELRVFGYADAHTEDDRQVWKPAEVEAFSPWPPKLFGYSPRFLPALAGFRPDLIHAHGLWTYLSAASLKVHRKSGTPLIVSPHGMLDAWALQFSSTKKKIVARLFQDEQLHSAAAVHALTKAEARSIRAYGLKNPIVVIPNGVNLPVLSEQSTPPPWKRQDSGRDRVLLFLSRVHPKKGLSQLLEAWAGFSRSGAAGSRWRLVIAGWDEIGHEVELRAFVSDKGLGGSVEFVGPLFGAAKAAALANADAFVLPSHSEGLPMAVLEAWASGKPALITKACNLGEGADAGAAIEVETTVAAVGDGLRRLAEMSDVERRAMGAAGRALVERRFTWEKIGADFGRVYRAVVARETLPEELLFNET